VELDFELDRPHHGVTCPGKAGRCRSASLVHHEALGQPCGWPDRCLAVCLLRRFGARFGWPTRMLRPSRPRLRVPARVAPRVSPASAR
jgi:hypothetical protein